MVPRVAVMWPLPPLVPVCPCCYDHSSGLPWTIFFFYLIYPSFSMTHTYQLTTPFHPVLCQGNCSPQYIQWLSLLLRRLVNAQVISVTSLGVNPRENNENKLRRGSSETSRDSFEARYSVT